MTDEMNLAVEKMAPFALELSRFIRAPRERVFNAFVDPQELRAWYCPRGLSVQEAAIEPWPGGSLRIIMQSSSGERFTVFGTIEAIERPARLVHTWQWESGSMASGGQTRIEICFSDKDGGTRVDMRHSGFTAAAAREVHSGGWSSQYDKLVGLLDGRGTAATLTLIGVGRSNFTRTARMGFVEKGVAYTLQPAMPHSPEVTALNPFGRIPVLTDGELVIFETTAILRYLDEGFEGPPLWPRRFRDRVRCEQWVSAICSYVFSTLITGYARHYFMPTGPDGKPDRAAIDASLGEVARQLSLLDAAYGASSFLAGESLSAADLLLAPILFYLESCPEGPSLMQAAPNVQRAQGIMRTRRSYLETQPEKS